MSNKRDVLFQSELTPTVTQETLESTPARAFQFLIGAGTVPAVRSALATFGYDEEQHQLGWSLLHAIAGYATNSAALITPSDPLVRDAIAELDASDEDVFRRVRACLGRLHPEQAKVVLDGIAPTDGPGAVMGMLTLLDRIDGLAKSKNKADHAAVATLAKRGLDERERTRFRDLVRVAMKGTSEPEQTIDPEAEQRAQNRQRALVQLRAWYEDWSEMARSVIKRKDRLIRLGLARRKSPSSAGARNGPSKPPAIPANQPTDGATANASQG